MSLYVSTIEIWQLDMCVQWKIVFCIRLYGTCCMKIPGLKKKQLFFTTQDFKRDTIMCLRFCPKLQYSNKRLLVTCDLLRYIVYETGHIGSTYGHPDVGNLLILTIRNLYSIGGACFDCIHYNMYVQSQLLIYTHTHVHVHM